MNDQTRRKALRRWITGELKDGIALTDDLLNFLDATFGTYDLSSVLAHADSSDIDSLLELLFYPDTKLQMRFEARWGQELFTEQDLEVVIVSLCALPLVARISLPQTQEKISVPVPAFASRSFVQRLNICWQPPVKLIQAMDKHCVDDGGLMARVQLRNARLKWHDAQISLVTRFLPLLSKDYETFTSDLGFLISILSELAVDGDPFNFLIGKKFFYFQSLCSAEDFERKRLSSNMEIMMMAGARSAHGSICQWRQFMRRIDRICRALFGRTQFFQQPDSHCVDFQNGLNIRNVTRLLS
jgi:hypothetical protein